MKENILELSSLVNNIPHWPTDFLFDRPCPFCNNLGIPVYRRADKLIIHYCNACSCHFVSPSPSTDALSTFYADYHTEHKSNKPIPSRATVQTLLRSDPFIDYRNRVLSSLIRDKSGAMAFDIGFGLGYNLCNLNKMGFYCSGIDPDAEAVTFVKDILGFQHVHKGSFEAMPDPGIRFNLITAYDVIEHLIDPISMLKKAALLLKPDGLLAIFTPHGPETATTQDPILFKLDFEHLQYLSLISCTTLSKILNLPLVHLEASGFPVVPSSVAKNPRPFSRLKLKTLNILRNNPAIAAVNHLRHKLFLQYSDNRRGNYNLFAVYQNHTIP